MLMKNGVLPMKILKIDGGIGYFWVESAQEWRTIEVIDKSGLLSLLNIFLDGDVEMDSPTAHNLPNEVHKIIYSHIYEKLSSLFENKSSFRDDSERRYFDEINKYSLA